MLGCAAVGYWGWGWDAAILQKHIFWGLMTQFCVHFLYTKGGFVDRADSTVAIFAAWFWMTGCSFHSTLSWTSGAGLLLALGAWRPILQIQRQPSTGHLGFVAGALMGLSCWLEPGLWGGMVGMLLSHFITRSFQAREIALIFVGLLWPWVMLSAWIWILSDMAGMAVVPHFPKLPVNFELGPLQFPFWGFVVLGIWLLWGIWSLAGMQARLGLTTLSIRRNTLILSWTSAFGSLLMDAWNPNIMGLSPLSWGLLAIGSSWVAGVVVPETGRAFDGLNQRRQRTLALIVFFCLAYGLAVWSNA